MISQNSISVFLVVLVFTSMIGGVATVSADSNTSSVVSPAVADATDWRGEIPGEVIRYGSDSVPSFVVSVESNKTDAIETWASESESREVKKQIDSNTFVVVAPLDDVHEQHLISSPSGLSTYEYVESVSFNIHISLIEPPGERANLSLTQKLAFGQYNPLTESPWKSGIAVDANETTPAEVRENTGVDTVSQTGNGTRVAIIDTGLNYDSDLYQDRVVAGKNFITGETINTSSGNYNAIADGNHHGSWVAAAVAADAPNDTYDGIAPDAEIAVAKALADDGSGSSGGIVDAVLWSCKEQNADVVSMSLGSPIYSQALSDAVTTCVEEYDATVVVAVGNAGYNPASMYVSSPADTQTDGVISVGATTNEKPENASVAYFSEVGPDRGLDSEGATAGASPDVAMPGMSVTAPISTDSGVQYKSLSGTSMATPYQSGVIALAMEANSSLKNNPAGVESAVEQYSEPIPNAGVYEVGHGMGNAHNMINEVEPDRDQREVRTNLAESRDNSYTSYSTSWLIESLESVQEIL